MTDHAAQAARAQHMKELRKLSQVMRECEQGQLVCPVYLTRIEAIEAGLAALDKAGASALLDVQGIAAIAWRCIRECKDYEGPPVMCPAHQEEAKALVGSHGNSAAQESSSLPQWEPPQTWQPIASAPKDGTVVIVHAAEREGLPAFQTVCRWHPDAGWCVCELREVTHWMPLPAPPAPEEGT